MKRTIGYLVSKNWNKKQYRFLQTSSNTATVTSNKGSTFIELRDLKLKIHETWLRHHCRCKDCFSTDTNELKLEPNKSLLLSKIKSMKYKGTDLNVEWSDGHLSQYCIEYLIQNVPKEPQVGTDDDATTATTVMSPINSNFQSILKNPLEELSIVHYKDLMENESGVGKLLQNILNTGFGVVDQVNGYEETKLAHNRISHPIRTIYGEGVTVHAPDQSQNDAAYSNVPLPLHTDTSYFTEPMGLQSFHILSRSGTGGLNCFSDGFLASKILYEEDPKLYEILTKIKLPFQFLEKGKYDLQAIGPTLQLHEFNGQLAQVRYNPRHVTTLSNSHLSMGQIQGFYEAYIRFTAILNENQLWIQLNPGTILWIDNWRILHGRSGFTGHRSVASAYFPRSDWLSKARVLNIKV